VRTKAAAWAKAEAKGAELVMAAGKLVESLRAAGNAKQALFEAAQSAYDAMPSPKQTAANYRLGIADLDAIVGLELMRAGLATNQHGSTLPTLPTLPAVAADAAGLVRLARGAAL
jgi:hypothetical protein